MLFMFLLERSQQRRLSQSPKVLSVVANKFVFAKRFQGITMQGTCVYRICNIYVLLFYEKRFTKIR